MKKQIQPLNNHYWFKYKDVESKVVELSYMTHFDDNQLAVYSFHIADLMIQIASEYESVVVDLFQLCSTGNKKASKLSETLSTEKIIIQGIEFLGTLLVI